MIKLCVVCYKMIDKSKCVILSSIVWSNYTKYYSIVKYSDNVLSLLNRLLYNIHCFIGKEIQKLHFSV